MALDWRDLGPGERIQAQLAVATKYVGLSCGVKLLDVGICFDTGHARKAVEDNKEGSVGLPERSKRVKGRVGGE